MQYECRFINHANRVFSLVDFEAKNDSEAIRHALTVHWSGVGKGFEIWKGNRLLRSVLYGKSQAAETARTAKE